MRDWRICPRCAAGLRHGPVPGEDADRLHCPACGLVLYENPAPTVSAIVERDGRVLLTRRGIEPPPRDVGHARRLHRGRARSRPEALRRELREETGLDDRGRVDFLGIYPDRYGDGAPTLNVFYTARVVGRDEARAARRRDRDRMVRARRAPR